MEHIEREVQSLIQTYGTNCPFKIAKALDIEVYYENLGAISGYYNQSRRIKFIHLNENLSEDEKRFVCAHELGHAVQHSGVNAPFIKEFTFFSLNKIEQEANAFAIYLLFNNNSNEQLTTEIALNRYGIPKKLLESHPLFSQ